MSKTNGTLGPRGVFQWILKGSLIVDMTYQRMPSAGKVAAIAANFLWAACGTLLVVDNKDGTYTVVDGQHRLEAALLRDDIASLPCLVFENRTQAEQARDFVVCDKERHNLTHLATFKAMAVAGDERTIRAAKILAEYGIHVPEAATHTRRDICTCPTVVLSMLDDLPEVLDFIVHVWPEDDNRLRHSVLRGVKTFKSALERHGKGLLDKDVKKKIQSSSLTVLRQAAVALARFGNISEPRAMGEALVNHYNSKRSRHRISV